MSFRLMDFKRAVHCLKIFWLITESDFATFVLPNVCFGLFAHISGICTTSTEQVTGISGITRLLQSLAFNWSNLLIFDLANQSGIDSIREDCINKPWRPVPSGLLTSTQMQYILFTALPIVFGLNYALGVAPETVVLFTLTWIYNGLGGGDGLGRNPIIAIAFACYNSGSLRVTAGLDAYLSKAGLVWICTVSGVILTTMHVQDFKDQEGDRKRGRLTPPLLFGEMQAKVFAAIFIVFWSAACAQFWGFGLPLYTLQTSLGLLTSYCVMRARSISEDRFAWKVWCLWTATLYTGPALHLLQVSMNDVFD